MILKLSKQKIRLLTGQYLKILLTGVWVIVEWDAVDTAASAAAVNITLNIISNHIFYIII